MMPIESTVKFYRSTFGVSELPVWLLRLLEAKLSKTTPLYKLHPKEVLHPLFVRINSSDVWAYQQVFVDYFYDFEVRSPPSVIVDAGANIGLTAIYFANKYPKARIIAIEPERSNFDLLVKNAAPYENIIPVHAALWNRRGEIRLVDPQQSYWGFMTQDEAAEASHGAADRFCHKVDALTMDDVVREYDLKKIDILKIDIEGAEKEVFENTASWIDRVEALLIELHDRIKPGCSRSFYNGSPGFDDDEWQQGDVLFLSKNGYLTRRKA